MSYKDRYPPQKCPLCGNDSFLYSISATCAHRYDYKFQCSKDTCRKKFVIKGPDPTTLKKLNPKKKSEGPIVTNPKNLLRNRGRKK